MISLNIHQTNPKPMTSKTFPFVLVSCFLLHEANASPKDALITWIGNAGYRASILMTYDDSFPTVGAWGGGAPISGTPTNQGISQLSASFYTPSSLTPVFSVNDISNSIINYKFLTLSFNTTTATLSGSFDVGKDSFAEGEPGSSAGQYYLLGPSPSLIDSFLAQQVDSGGHFTVTIVPEPSAWSLVLAGAVATFARARLTKHGFCSRSNIKNPQCSHGL